MGHLIIAWRNQTTASDFGHFPSGVPESLWPDEAGPRYFVKDCL
jgi:hypothetical protein